MLTTSRSTALPKGNLTLQKGQQFNKTGGPSELEALAAITGPGSVSLRPPSRSPRRLICDLGKRDRPDRLQIPPLDHLENLYRGRGEPTSLEGNFVELSARLEGQNARFGGRSSSKHLSPRAYLEVVEPFGRMQSVLPARAQYREREISLDIT